MKLIKRQAKGSKGPPAEAATELLAECISRMQASDVGKKVRTPDKREKRRTIIRGALEKNDAPSLPAYTSIQLYKEQIRTNKNDYHASVVGVSSCFQKHLSTGVHQLHDRYATRRVWTSVLELLVNPCCSRFKVRPADRQTILIYISFKTCKSNPTPSNISYLI